MRVHRRLLVSGAALGAAFALFHGQLAVAVVTSGDDALRRGDVESAVRLYGRAARLDPGSSVAADRLAFNLALRHDRTSARLAIAVATQALGSVPDPALLADRAFAEVQLRRWHDAQLDFSRAGLLAHDARFDHFAARMALRFGDHAAARRYALRALHDDPAFAPARALLRAVP